MKLVWPNEKTAVYGLPLRIEKFLADIIRSQRITLIGELDLATPVEYGDVNWSLFELAKFQIERDVMKDFLSSSSKMGKWLFPASLAIWSVGHAQSAEDGSFAFWNLPDYSDNQQVKLAQLFTQSIAQLRLETFAKDLEGKQRHVQLARIHALIPDFAIERYGAIVKSGVTYESPIEQILEEVLSDITVSKGVSRLFTAHRDLGMDLIERTFNYIAYGQVQGLPERIISRLDNLNYKKSLAKKTAKFPSPNFFESERRAVFVNAQHWIFTDENDHEVEFDNFPPGKFYASNENTSRIPLLDTSRGFLVFDDNGKFVNGSKLPDSAGFILWNSDVQIADEFQILEPSYLLGDGWESWQYSYFQGIERLSITGADSKTYDLTRINLAQIETYPIHSLLFAEEFDVFSEYPRVIQGSSVKITDHESGAQYLLEPGERVKPNPSNPRIDITASLGLGRSTSIQGIVLPGLEVCGLENALLQDEIRLVSIAAPQGCEFTYPAEIAGATQANMKVYGKEELKIDLFEFKDSANSTYSLNIEVPILSWTISFKNGKSFTGGTELLALVSEKVSIEAVILHGIGEYMPILKVGEVETPGKKRRNDARYDLRFLQKDTSDSSVEVVMTWNFQQVPLLSFKSLINGTSNSTAAKSRKAIILKSFEELDNSELLIELGIFTSEEWNNYQELKVAESLAYRDRLRTARSK
jgi:hypothetical protein